MFAGCLDTASEGAQRLRVEASPKLRLVNMDVRWGLPNNWRMAASFKAEAGQHGCQVSLAK